MNRISLFVAFAFTCIALTAEAQTPKATKTGGAVVTRENFIRAETDRMFSDLLKLSGGVNRLFRLEGAVRGCA